MLRFIAHAGETDSVVAESATHFLENWYYALPSVYSDGFRY